jgi:ABC-type cobalamin/Fe3+-siderophores transport system ATPase subunit
VRGLVGDNGAGKSTLIRFRTFYDGSPMTKIIG